MTVEILPRTIQAGNDGTGQVNVQGFGLEVVDQGAYGPENVLQLVRGEDGIGGERFDDVDTVPCVNGTRQLGEFSAVRLITPRTWPVLDRVKVRIYTQPGVRTVDAQPNGRPIVRWLARGSVFVPVGSYGLIYNSATLGEFDRFRTEERFEGSLCWHGWISSVRTFSFVVWARRAAANAMMMTQYRVSEGPAAGLPGVPPYGGARFMQFWGPSGPLFYPPALTVEAYIVNTDVADENFEFCLGVRSHS